MSVHAGASRRTLPGWPRGAARRPSAPPPHAQSCRRLQTCGVPVQAPRVRTGTARQVSTPAGQWVHPEPAPAFAMLLPQGAELSFVLVGGAVLGWLDLRNVGGWATVTEPSRVQAPPLSTQHCS